MGALRFELACMCIQNCGVVLKDCASRSAVSAVTPRFTRTSSLRRTVDIPSVLAAGGLRHRKRLQELLEKNLSPGSIAGPRRAIE